jgi:hypothetical protein
MFPRNPSHRRRPVRTPCRVDALESRVLLATFTVTNTADDGPGSLRQAMLDANHWSSPTIAFAIPGGGVHTIRPLSALPIVASDTTIDGATQPGYAGTPLIELDGSGAGPTADGVNLSRIANYSGLVRGLAVNGFGGNGITLYGAGRVEGCYVGLTPAGDAARPNGGAGVVVWGNIEIGGTTVAQRNVISGNRGPGISGRGTLNIFGNYIGTDATGTVDLGNGGDGITLSFVDGPWVKGNLISGNGGDGLHVEGRTVSGNVSNNYIGTDATGTAALGNDGDGVDLLNCQFGFKLGVAPADAPPPPVIDPAASGRNVISANGGNGVRVSGTEKSVDVEVSYNYIGTDAAGTRTLGNHGSGVYVASGNPVIGGGAARGNVISGNGGDGVTIARPFIPGLSVTRVLIGANRIGTSAADAPLGNAGHGVAVLGSNGVAVGGTRSAADGNTIAHNGGAGVWVVGATADGVQLARNRVFSNTLPGIDLGGDGVTPNDPGDADTGPNRLVNFPVITEVGAAPASGPPVRSVAHVTMSAEPQRQYEVEFFAAPATGGAARWVGTALVTTDAAGNGAAVTSLDPVAPGELVSATATDAKAFATSEFGPAVAAAPADVYGRYLFYNHSALDGYGAGADARDDAAIVPNAYPLPGTGIVGFNTTTYSRGLNGVMIDFARLPAGAVLGADDFEFRRGPGDSAATWAAAPAPSQITVRRGAGVAGSDRVTLVWPDAGTGANAAVANAWLQVTVKATPDTGLSRPDVFSFGNLVGEVIFRGGARVQLEDVLRVRSLLDKPATGAAAECDFDKSGRVDARDLAAARRNLGRTLGSLYEVPAPPAPAASVLSADRLTFMRRRAYVFA